MIDISKYLELYKSCKNVKIEEEELISTMQSVLEKSYSCICMDIDKTLINNQEIDNEMLGIVKKIIEKNVSICFITGRGRTSSRKVLEPLYTSLKNEGLNIKNIICASSNGAILLETDKSYFDSEEMIVSKTKLEEYIKLKKEIRKSYLEYLIQNKLINSDLRDTIIRSENSSGETSLRFPFYEHEIFNDDEMMLALQEIISKTDLAEELNILKGKHKDKLIYEVSIADKLKAVQYFQKKLEVANEDILKIGDQANKYGNDYSMLNTFGGFSVDELDRNTMFIWPVIGEDGRQIKGISATKKLLNDIEFNER